MMNNSSVSNNCSCDNNCVETLTFPPTFYEYHYVTIYMVVITVTLGIPGLLGNVWVIATILSRMMTAGRGAGGTYIFIISLAATDIFSLISRPCIITLALLLGSRFNSHLITDAGTLWMVFNIQYHLLTIAISRYCSVRFWAQYQRWFTRRNCALLVGSCWLLSLLVIMPLLTGSIKYGLLLDRYTYLYTVTYRGTSKFATFSLATFVLCLIILVYCYTAVIRGIRARSRSLNKAKVTGSAAVSTSSTGAASTSVTFKATSTGETNSTLAASEGDLSTDGASVDIGAGTSATGPVVPPNVTVVPPNGNKSQPAQMGIKKHEMTLARQFTVITSFYTLTIVFFFLTVGLSAVGVRSVVITMANNTFFALNFACHPAIYWIFNTTLRRNMLATIKCAAAGTKT